MSVRRKVFWELGILSVLTVAFLCVFPKRSPAVDVGLAAVALMGLAWSAGYTRNVIWAAAPAPADRGRWSGVRATVWVTVPPVLLFLAVGMVLGYRAGGWPGVARRVGNWGMLAAFGCYLPWALMQQTLFQFYLLGRLLALAPRGRPAAPVLITGVCISLVHLPDWWTTVVTAGAGVVWAWLYYRYRRLLPLAVSHASMGTAFYYGVFGQDLASEWRKLLP